MRALFRRNPLVGILIIALGLRAGTAVWVQSRLDADPDRRFLIAGDAEGYWELGRRIAACESYEVYDPPRRVLRMPGFPAVLAVSIAVFGERLLPARLLLAVVGTAACGMVYWLGREVFSRRVGLIAAACAAVSPPLVGFSVLVLSETAFAACLAASLAAMARLTHIGFAAEDRLRGLAWSAAVGTIVALAVFMRPTWLPAAPLFAACYVCTAEFRRAALARGAVVLLSTGMLLLPWTVRNSLVTGHPVVTTLWVGPSLYDGLNPQAAGESDMAFFDRERLSARLTEYEVDRHYRRKALEFVREHPWRTVELAAAKFVRFWKPWPNAAQFDRWPYRLAVAAAFLPMAALALRGLWVHRREFWAWALTAGPVLLFTLVHMVFVGSLRYRLPAEYPLWVLAAAGLVSVWPRET
ncbi:MAG: glycosyltransferase family 39 protein, partial [Vicinamibacterales bacterium]